MITFKQFINEEVELDEDGVVVAGPTNVTGVQSSTDPISATAVRRKKKPVLFKTKRIPPKM